jgi:hypothetical protein
MDRLQLQELIAGLGGAVEDFGRAGAVARGGKKDSGSFYQGLAQSAGRARDRELEDERRKQEAVRQRVLDDYKAKEDARSAARFEAEQAEMSRKAKTQAGLDDPNSEMSIATREIASQVLPGRDLSKFSASQLNSIMPPDKIIALQEQRKAREQSARDAQEERRLKRLDKEEERRQRELTPKYVSPLSGKPLSEGQKKVDQDYAKQYNEFSAQGAAKARTTIEQLEEFQRQLEAESKKRFQSGGGRLASILPDVARTDQSIIWKRDIPAKANLVLKDLFGGQLSNDERKSESATYYDDILGPAENAKKLGEKIKQLRAGYENESRKAKYYERFGTLDGFTAESSVDEPEGEPKGVPMDAPRQPRQIQGGGKIRVSNGAETLEIDAEDEQEAAKEGFRRVP